MEKPEIPHSKWLRSVKRVYINPFQEIYMYTLDLDGHKKDFYVLNAAKRVGVVAEKNGAILLVKQYRLLLDRLAYEIPGGRIDDNESPRAAAVRETYEETGVRCKKLRSVLFYHVGLDTNYNPTYIFHSRDTEETERISQYHEGELTTHEWVPIPKCLKMIRDGRLVDSMSIIAIQACLCGRFIFSKKKQ